MNPTAQPTTPFDLLMRRCFAVCLCAVVSAQCLVAQGLSNREKFFERDVRPLLIKHCHECHGGSLQESELRLDSLESMLQGGISGPAVVARNVEQSLLIRAVTGDGVEQMPPDEPLESEQIAILKRWVRMGLPWTAANETGDASEIPLGDQQAIAAAAKDHWAFLPLTPGDVPSLEQEEKETFSHWSHNPIDGFVFRRLRASGLRPSAPASRSVLLRRLSYDLVGLPPDADAIASFVADERSDSEAVSEVVQRLLASDHHGERWARYWLDLARYADTRDWQAQAELRYPFAYTYRDYVIQSFNDDKPYDQFLREQLAADFYTDDPNAPELAALGFLTVGPRFRNNRLEQIADKIDVVCRGVMGLTVACARCHDHKYDPVPIEDYYSLYGVFASTEIPETLPQLAAEHADASLRQDYEAKLAEKEKDLADYKQALREDAIADVKKQLPVYLEASYQMNIARSIQVRGAISKYKILETGITPLSQQLARRLGRGADKNHPVTGPWHQAFTTGDQEIASSLDDWIKAWRSDGRTSSLVLDQLELDGPVSRHEVLKSYGVLFQRILDEWATFQADNPQSESLADPQREAIRVLLLEEGGWLDLDVEEVANASRLLGKGRKALGDLQKAITEVQASHPGSPPRAMVVQDADAIVKQPFVLLRGEANRRGERVPRQFPRILSGDTRSPFRIGSGRKELAEAVTSPDNPMTARVIVNRVWTRYFGKGLVASMDDFGLRSEPPSHPLLLDHLAAQFIENGWSLKWLHHTIATSQTYAQSSVLREDAAAKDPDNRLLWRQNRRRLDFEALRDSMLAVSGRLDPMIGGRSVRLSDRPYSMRRSLYAYVDRIEMDPILRTFDFASPTASAASRAETMIPQQALFCMNHPFVAEMARGLVEQCDGQSSETSAKIDSLYRQVFGRDPSAQERQLALAYIQQASDVDNEPSQIWTYGLGSEEMALGDPLRPLPFWTGNTYQGSVEFPDPVLRHARLSSSGGHPGKDRDHCVVRRWTAPADGTVRIGGTLRHSRDNGDGVIAIVRFPSGQQRFQARNENTKTVIPPMKVRRGETIDLIVSPGPTTTSDAYIWQTQIIGVGGELKGQTFDSRADFGPPPPPPLQPLGQLAQALMLTNEFMFID